MEVMNPINFQELQQRINGLSKDYFSFSTTVKDCDFSVYKPVDSTRNIVQDSTPRITPLSKNRSRSLIAWGCGEFGQHGLDQSGDVTFEMAFSKFMSGESMLPDGELPVTSVCGSSHTLVLTGTDQVYSWGNGSSGQLGNGTCMTTIKPTLVPMTLDGKIQGMACGARHSFVWTIKGYCYSFGNNFNAQLGYNFSKVDFKENQLKPVLVELFPDTRVKEVACGARHSLFLLSTGRVMAVGSNQHGQIGNDTTEDVVIPALLDDLNCITHVACGNIHSLASHENGFVYAWGYGKAFGNKTRHVATPQKFTPQDIESNVVISLAAGDCHSMILYDDGKLFTWGNNYEGQLGVGKDIKYQNEPQAIPCHLLPRPVKQIACSETTSAAVTGKGELFLWGKNAGLIHSDKPSQYFQDIPHHIKMDGLFVLQVSCGAWHVSVIVKHSADNGDEMFHEADSEWCEAEQPTLSSCETASCENGDNIVSQDTTEKQKNENCWVKSMNEGDRSLESSQNEIPQVNVHAQLKTNSMDTCFITKCSSSSEFSQVENKCDGNEMLAKNKQINKYSEDVTVDQHEKASSKQQPKLLDNLSLFNVDFYDVDKTAFRTNDVRKVVDPSFHYDLKEEYHEPSLLSVQNRNKNAMQPEEGYSTTEKQEKTSRTTNGHLDKNPTTTYSQKHPLLSYPSDYGDKGNTNNSLLQKENETLSCTSQDLCSIEFTTKDNISFEKDKGGNNTLLNKSTSNDVVKNNEALGNNNYARNDNESDELENKSAIKNHSFAGNNDGTVKVVFENNKEQTENHWNEIKSPQAKRKTRSITEKNISEVIPSSLKQNSNKESLVLRRNIKLAVTPLQNHTIKSTLTRNIDTKQGTRAVHNKTIESKLTTTLTQNNTIDCNTQVITRQPTVPVIDLGFGKMVRGAEQSRMKPSFTTFRNVWKASNLFREKQRQKMIGTCNRRGSDGMFSLECMLPNRPIRAIKDIEERSKMNEKNSSICLNNDFSQELRTQSYKAKCCHHKGQVLPPICSCKKNGVVTRKRDTLTNVFIDRK